MWKDRALQRCKAWCVFFLCTAITLQHGHSCHVATDLSPRNMILLIIWPSFGRRQPVTPDTWFTPVRVCVFLRDRFMRVYWMRVRIRSSGTESIPWYMAWCRPTGNTQYFLVVVVQKVFWHLHFLYTALYIWFEMEKKICFIETLCSLDSVFCVLPEGLSQRHLNVCLEMLSVTNS